MRFLLIILLLANIALYLYVRSGDTSPAPSLPPVADDKVALQKSLAEGEPVPAPPPALPASPPEPATACFEWGPITDAQLGSARVALDRIPNIGAYRETRHQGLARSWLVSIDGFHSRVAAVNRANELRRQGISDISVLDPERGASTFALSLGVFSSEQSAQSRAASLSEKRIGNVKIAPRGSTTAAFFVVSNATPALEQNLRELSRRFADSDVQNIACSPSPSN
ncbi:MAG: hypothetical protein FWC42_01115 [Proteobacteria bacterium]|nr:hypothetical protein [Pseudomonadota bacterium]